MEVHFVHWNTKYSNVEEAVSKEDGLAVVAFLYQVTLNLEGLNISATDNKERNLISKIFTELSLF